MNTLRPPVGAAVVAVLGAVLLAGCATETGGASPAPVGSTTPGGTVTPSDSTPPASPFPPQPSRDPVVPTPTPGRTGPASGPTSLTGTVEMAGIEGGCLVLRTGDVTYELLGGDRTLLRPGARVVVQGKINPNVATICQMGPVFEVSQVRPA